MKRGRIIAILMVLLLPLGVYAQEQQQDSGIDEDALFGGGGDGSGEAGDSGGGLDEDALFGGGESTGQDSSDEDSLFGGDDMVMDITGENAETGQAAADLFLTDDEVVRIGGSLSSSLQSYWTWSEAPQEWADWTGGAENRLGISLGGSVYLDARPDADLRIFMKAKTSYPFSITSSGYISSTPVLGVQGTAPIQTVEMDTPVNLSQLNLQIFEFYSDIAFRDLLFFRFGKQTVKWGTGYFFSPADIISLTPIDVDDPEAEREGPLSLKVSFPFGLNTLDAYIIGDDQVRAIEDLGVAARGVFYLAPLELGVGLGYQKDRPFRIVSTARMPIGDWNLFAEGRLSFGRQEQKVDSDGVLTDDDQAYVSATGGVFYTNADWNLTAAAQYLYQGEGYPDTEGLYEAAIQQVFAGNLPGSVLNRFGQHYTILLLSLNEIFIEELSASVQWQANWTDTSGLVSPSISLRIFDGLSISGGIYIPYGDEGDEFTGEVRNPFGDLSTSLTVSIGGGRF
ncbi:hypothetical protein [Spirochaeta lutea]|uniref:Bacterial surface antigen (D15) domain-containing protein n=1 Tax=Spirochaeta lutea TaxID=1480694 RepID=A0A098R205_9SPIO|nr:hypothetical protein [Spirochaeta lutea]KGE72742.1 hypothetical protein DC28_06820 [Spirochaeta lutea]